MNTLQRLVLTVTHYVETLLKDKKGYNPDLDPPDERDYRFANHFPDDIFGAALPDAYQIDGGSLSTVPFQNSILSCVSATCTFINSSFSKQEDNDVFLAWRFPYALVRHYPGGTSVRENLGVLRQYGQCEDVLLPQRDYILGERVLQDKKTITPRMVENAKNYKIQAYYRLNQHSQVEVKTAIMKAPVGITLWVGYSWRKGGVIQWDGVKRYGHMVAIIGWNDIERCWIIADWDGRDYKKISYDYPVLSAWVVLDKSDKLKGKLMRPYKLKGTDRLLVVLPSGKYQWVSSPAQWQALNEKQVLIGDVKEIHQDELDRMERDESPLVVVK